MTVRTIFLAKLYILFVWVKIIIQKIVNMEKSKVDPKKEVSTA